MKHKIVLSFIFAIIFSTQMFAQSCVLPDFIQTIYLELEDHDVKEGYYTDILSDWQQKKFTVEGKSYLTLDIKEIKYIDLKYKFDVFQESYLSGSVIKLTSVKNDLKN